MDIFYNYVYLDPRKPGKYEYKNICFLYEPIYVGKGKDNRLYNHITYFKNDRKNKINSILYNKLNKIYKNNLEPIVIMFNENINENICYDYEANLISEIGTISGETDIRGPLCNFCIDNRPPNHKGKTYEEIYGKEKAEEQLKLRTKIQKDRGGYFGGRKHTKETLSLLSKIQSGEGNGMYGKKQKQSTKDKISKANKGKLSKLAKTFMYISPDNIKYKVSGNYKLKFCNDFNISRSALDKRINTGICPKYGKSKGWCIYHYEEYIKINNIQEEEIISYTVGAVKQDVDDQDYSDFDL